MPLHGGGVQATIPVLSGNQTPLPVGEGLGVGVQPMHRRLPGDYRLV